MTDAELIAAVARVAGPGFERALTDDGDALRLAVKLELCVTVIGCGMAEAKAEAGQSCFEHETETYDTHAATRRAIVRAAAAMIKG